MKWIDGTDFGYYVLCPESHVAAWDCTEFMDAFEDYVGWVVLPEHGDVLVLGGEALPATYLDRRMTFVRNYAADDDSGLEQAVEQAMGSDDWTDAFEVSLGGSYRLMDCMAAGDDVAESDAIRVHIPEGRYLVQSLVIEAFPDDQFMLERLVRI
ncbi:Imm21 family immunity protein [Kitasatospora sp. NPDC057015]|uniref:Imm21 family immunity protein n=1 Tax=Kitasatospora sp. NPDC057015 TaxID=3346001 RepID=UPI00362A0F4B